MEIRVIVVFCAVIFTAARAADTKQYRDDYVYNRQTDAFYKVHIDSDLWRKEQLLAICEVEGAALMGATTQADIALIHALMKNYPDKDNVYIATDHLQPDLPEGQPIIDTTSESDSEDESTYEMLTSDGTFETVSQLQDLPFVCKVQAKDIPPYDQRCGVHARGYRYYSAVGSCYSIPQISYTWYEAFAECQAEGAHLAVVNSDTERMVLQNITALDGTVRNSWHQAYFHIGFRAEKPVDVLRNGNAPRVFKTIFNQTLEEAGFSEWSATEPNNLGGRENCGSVFHDDGKLNDINCSGLYAFICEKEVRTQP